MWFTAYLTMVNCLGNLAVLYVIDKKPYFSAQKCVQSPPIESASTGIIVICLREASYLISTFKYLSKRSAISHTLLYLGKEVYLQGSKVTETVLLCVLGHSPRLEKLALLRHSRGFERVEFVSIYLLSFSWFLVFLLFFISGK